MADRSAYAPASVVGAVALERNKTSATPPEKLEPGRFGVLEFLVRSAPDLREAFRDVARYHLLITPSARVRLDETAHGAHLTFDRGEHSRHGPGYLLSIFGEYARRLTNAPLRAAHVWLSEPTSAEELGPSLVVDSLEHTPGRSGAFLEAAELDRPIPSADPKLHELLHWVADRILLERPHSHTVEQVHDEIEATLGEGPSITTVSRRMGVGARTLQRRLARDGVTFSDLLVEVRQRVLRRWLFDQDCSIKELSARLGFADPSVFSRAFKLWTGSSPSAYRRLSREHDPGDLKAERGSRGR